MRGGSSPPTGIITFNKAFFILESYHFLTSLISFAAKVNSSSSKGQISLFLSINLGYFVAKF